MRLVTFESGKAARVGVVEGEYVWSVEGVLTMLRGRRAPRAIAEKPRFKQAARVVLDGGAPRDMIGLLERGAAWRKALGVVTSALASGLGPAETSKRRGQKSVGRRAAPLADRRYCRFVTPLSKVKLLAPIVRPGKITCIGLNYADHAREQGIEPPDRPIFFLKSANTICGPGDPIQLPPNSSQVDYEAEFAVVLGKRGRRIPEEKAMEYVAGYTILHDVTARDMQFGDKQWFRGKSCDTFAPTGPWIVTAEEIPDINNLRVSLTLNGETLQDSNTSNLIYKVPYLISYLSQSVTWEPGDLLSTGTPPGVGVFRKPPIFLKAGDTVSVSVERLGTLTNPVLGA
jgi:2-keto-4-pentenoate hydratase/2-oxohepta-3-ene-1,7-dioic acid hydratase in catechol pathway